MAEKHSPRGCFSIRHPADLNLNVVEVAHEAEEQKLDYEAVLAVGFGSLIRKSSKTEKWWHERCPASN